MPHIHLHPCAGQYHLQVCKLHLADHNWCTDRNKMECTAVKWEASQCSGGVSRSPSPRASCCTIPCLAVPYHYYLPISCYMFTIPCIAIAYYSKLLLYHIIPCHILASTTQCDSVQCRLVAITWADRAGSLNQGWVNSGEARTPPTGHVVWTPGDPSFHSSHLVLHLYQHNWKRIDGNDTCVVIGVPIFTQLSLCKYLSQPASWTKALALYICGKWYLGNIQVKKEGSFYSI